MSAWTLFFTEQAVKDAKKLEAAGLRLKAEKLLALLRKDPFATPLATKSSSATSPKPTPPHQHPAPVGLPGF